MIKNRLILSLLICFAFSKISTGQHVSVSAELDSTLMFIGGQMNLRLEVVQPEGLNVTITNFTDTITKNIEVVSHSRPDTIHNGNVLNILHIYRITSFDSGLHYIPPIAVEYLAGEMIERQESRSLGLMVINPFAEIDLEKGIFDIKQPLTLPFSILEIIQIVNWVLLSMFVLSLAVLGIHWWRKKGNPIKEILFREKPKDPPHVIALRELDRIKSEKIWQKGQFKPFYSQLTDTLRTYMEERFSFPAMEQTTPEILQALKSIELTDEKICPRMAQILEIADLVKFAKHESLPDENDNCLTNAYLFVNSTKIEDQKTNEKTAEKENSKTM